MSDQTADRCLTQVYRFAATLAWLNQGVFVGVGDRQAAGVVYDTYLVA